MPSEWMVMTNFAGGECFYQVFRLKDKNAVDHAGNREIIGGFDTEEAATEFCEKLNRGEICVSRS